VEAACESFELPVGHLVEVADGGEELYVAGGNSEGSPVFFPGSRPSVPLHGV